MRQLVELHGGQVRVSSAGLGQGATFQVELPMAPLKAAAEEEAPMPRRTLTGEDARPAEISSGISLAGVQVLVVDDEADARALVKRVLEDRGAEVRVAASAEEGMRLFQESAPNVLVSDIGMPVDDGYSFIRRLRALPAEEGGQTPAVALTAYARTEDRLKALQAGFSMHVAKPVDAAELLTVVASLARAGRESLA